MSCRDSSNRPCRELHPANSIISNLSVAGSEAAEFPRAPEPLPRQTVKLARRQPRTGFTFAHSVVEFVSKKFGYMTLSRDLPFKG
jgi:hypothetical protein